MKNSISETIKKKLRSYTEYPLVELNDRINLSSSNQKIPTNVYQTWENNLFGKTHARYINKFRDLNPELSFYLYDKDKRDNYMSKNWKNHTISQIYFNSILGPMKADIFRYCILYELGGYYFDIGKGCKIPLNLLHKSNHEAIITYEDNIFFYPPESHKNFKLLRPFNYILQWGLAFTSKHKFLEILINEICENYKFYKGIKFENPKLAILNFTGPGMYTKVMRKYIENHDMANFNELDVKFNNNGIFKIKGSSFRHYIVPSYTYLKNMKICN
tara:strand:+ start:57 stop:875 length:819 start_codon:yes stop_codon:yes gene_type:complete